VTVLDILKDIQEAESTTIEKKLKKGKARAK